MVKKHTLDVSTNDSPHLAFDHLVVDLIDSGIIILFEMRDDGSSSGVVLGRLAGVRKHDSATALVCIRGFLASCSVAARQ